MAGDEHELQVRLSQFRESYKNYFSFAQFQYGHRNENRYSFTDIYGEPYTYIYRNFFGIDKHTPHKINEFEFRHGIITLYEYTEETPHFK